MSEEGPRMNQLTSISLLKLSDKMYGCNNIYTFKIRS